MDILTDNVPFAVGLWACIYAADFLLTMLSARLYRQGVDQYIVYEQGLELTPYYKQDVAKIRWRSPRFLLAFVLSSLLLWTVGAWLRGAPFFFELLLGGWYLAEAAIISRHLRNLIFFFNLRYSGGITGHHRYATWFTYRSSAAELLTYALLYLGLYLLFGRVFFLGGLLSTTGAALYHWLLGNRARKASKMRPSQTGAGS